MMPVANARMYSVAPGAAAAWRALLEHAIARAGVAMDVVDHPPPAGLPELWSRPDLGAVFMCGWPFAQEGGVRPIVAAPIPRAGWSGGRPVYRASFVVAANSPHRTVNDVLGRRFAFNARHSHSGWNMPMAHLAAIGAPPFASFVGPFVTHQSAIRAVADGAADLAAIDSYVLDLLHRHDPSLASSVRVVATTPEGPIPMLVGTHPTQGDPLGEAARDRFRRALLELDQTAEGRRLLDALELLGFADVAAEDYAVALKVEADAA
ncbi:MAG TPA: PhnD/SsuA/transferrin family substrate-binding protein [Acetobacteraceae bacterium]|jgi:ABC-type phosphate/phosphonate transport system substrate-binding protein|nr:PhnD/SsuA/transferrin family substrate-binding protein [Acetobacteraceae bacterium]